MYICTGYTVYWNTHWADRSKDQISGLKRHTIPGTLILGQGTHGTQVFHFRSYFCMVKTVLTGTMFSTNLCPTNRVGQETSVGEVDLFPNIAFFYGPFPRRNLSYKTRKRWTKVEDFSRLGLFEISVSQWPGISHSSRRSRCCRCWVVAWKTFW